jgi:alpha-ketoglutarate-dependent taurine dioxygenase
MPRHVTPLSLNNEAAYQRWRDAKLADLPRAPSDLVVEVRDPRHLSDAEAEAIRDRCKRWNMAVYVAATGDEPDKAIPRRLGERFGLTRLDQNPGADADAISSISIQSDALHRGFIPYTDRPIAWHTDGYYNPPARQIHGFILHCVRPASDGGENALLDPEIAYIRLRDRDPEHIRALMHVQAMTIPANVVDGEELRPASIGPVFMDVKRGRLAMRYTDRKRNIEWQEDDATTAAVAALREIFEADDTPVIRLCLQAGWGIICNNVLHTRTRFSDAGEPRLLYRARYYDRIAGT